MPLRLVRRPKSPYWVVRGTVRGIRVEESTGVTGRRDAEDIRAKREAEIIAASIHGRAATATFAEAVNSYLKSGGRHRSGGSKRFLAPILEYFAVTPLVEIDLAAIERAAMKLFPMLRRRRGTARCSRQPSPSFTMRLGVVGARRR